MRFNKCGNSIVIVPSCFNNVFKPATKSCKFGTCANTLLAMIKSACGNFFAKSLLKKFTSVGIPFWIAISATFFAGSIPNVSICSF